MNYYDKHIGDFLKDTITLTMVEEGAYNRLLDQYYQLEKPLPLNLKEVYKLARADGVKEKKAVDAVLNKFFIKNENGFVQKRAQEVIEKYWDSDLKDATKRDNDKDRQARSRARRKALFEALRNHNIVPPYNTKTGELSQMLSRVTDGDNERDVTSDNTATQKPVTSNQNIKTNTVDDLTVPSVAPKLTVIQSKKTENPPEPNHHDTTPFAMHADWTPSDEFETLARVAGLSFKEKLPVQQLGEFKTYWLTHEHNPLNQSQWEHKFIQNLLHQKARASR